MKKILITGANSYIGTSFENYLKQWPELYQVDTVDMIDGSWREKIFTGYDTILHVAGIAHQKETKKNAPLYYKVNRDLAIETAKKAKEDGVKQFIFLSSMSVYGLTTGIITKETIPNPKTNYGKSKLQAESQLFVLQDDSFSISVLRPPMVYGKNCKGNFRTVVKMVKKLSIFPKINNKRSMIYIDNLCEFVKMLANNKMNGIFFPQNKKYMQTTHMMVVLASQIQRKFFTSWLLGIFVIIICPFSKLLKKAFGTLIYVDTEVFNHEYCVVEEDISLIISTEGEYSYGK